MITWSTARAPRLYWSSAIASSSSTTPPNWSRTVTTREATRCSEITSKYKPFWVWRRSKWAGSPISPLAKRLWHYDIQFCIHYITLSFPKITLGHAALALLLIQRSLARQLGLALMRILLRPNALYACGSASASAPMEMAGDFGYGFKPFVVFSEYKLSLGDLIADGKPSISDVILRAE